MIFNKSGITVGIADCNSVNNNTFVSANFNGASEFNNDVTKAH